MKISFAEALRRARLEKGLSQQQLAACLFVDRSSIASWETGRRVPDVLMIARRSECLGVDVKSLLESSEEDAEKPVVIVVDDDKIILSGSMSVLEEALPGAEISGFINPNEAVEFAARHQIALAFLDIEMGNISGMELCEKLLKQNPRTNVIYLTAYAEYSFDAWSTGACGFMLKPLNKDDIAFQLTRLRYPVRGLK